jgi:diacylglycerol kinase (ATP)
MTTGHRAASGASRPLVVIFNPTAGRRRTRRLAAALRLLEGRAEIGLKRTVARGDAEVLARGASGLFTIVVAGGDGTANEAINGLISAGGGRMAVLPLGTANVLAAELGIRDMASAARAAAGSATLAMRPGLANGRAFIMMAGVGFDAHAVAGVSHRLKRLFGKGAYVAETLRQLRRFPFPRYRVTIDGAVHEAASVIVARGRFYGGRFVLARDARLDQPWLYVCLFRRGGWLRAIGYALAIGLGLLHRWPGVDIIRARRVTIEGPPGDPVQGDGDIIATLPVSIELSPIVIDLLRPD